MVEQRPATPESVFWKAERRHRRAKEISQREAAQIFGYDQSTLSRKETRGGTLPSREDVIQFAKQISLDVVDREILLTTAGFALTAEVYESLLQKLQDFPESDSQAMSLNTIISQSLRIIRKRESLLQNPS